MALGGLVNTEVIYPAEDSQSSIPLLTRLDVEYEFSDAPYDTVAATPSLTHVTRMTSLIQFSVVCVGRQFKKRRRSSTDAVYDDLLASCQLDVGPVGSGRQSRPASLSAVTSRRVKDEVNAARKLELVTKQSHLISTELGSLFRSVQFSSYKMR